MAHSYYVDNVRTIGNGWVQTSWDRSGITPMQTSHTSYELYDISGKSVGARYTCGDVVECDDDQTMYQILDRGVPTDAIGSYYTVCEIYDECEITGGEFIGGVFYSGTFTGSEITDSKVNDIDYFRKIEYYNSEVYGVVYA